MSFVSRFEILTDRRVLIQEMTETLIFDLQCLVQLLEANIEAEEECAGIFDPANTNYPIPAQRHRARRDNLIAAISQFEGPRAADIH
jgi:hypothetical protein